jgi:polar amino acid transport system substrate-binding protein
MRAFNRIEAPSSALLRCAGLAVAAALGVGASLSLAGCAAPDAGPPTPRASAPLDPALRNVLAPTGTLRVAVYPGSPTSMLPATGTLPMRGVAVEVGRALAERLGVPAEIVVLPRVAEVVAALKEGRADLTVTNATTERAKDVDFTPPLLSLELGVLVRAGSPLATLQGWDTAGLRIGVSRGSSSERVLGATLEQATLVPQPTLQAAGEQLRAGTLDAFATNKAILFELADRVPGARVLEGRWGLEHLALAVPKGREAAMGELRNFVDAVSSNGTVARAAANAGLRGVAQTANRLVTP